MQLLHVTYISVTVDVSQTLHRVSNYNCLQFYVITRLKKKILINIFKTAHIAHVTGSRIKSQNRKIQNKDRWRQDEHSNVKTAYIKPSQG